MGGSDTTLDDHMALIATQLGMVADSIQEMQTKVEAARQYFGLGNEWMAVKLLGEVQDEVKSTFRGA